MTDRFLAGTMNESEDIIPLGDCKVITEEETWEIIRNARNHCFLNAIINCNEKPYDIDDVNTIFSYTDMCAYM